MSCENVVQKRDDVMTHADMNRTMAESIVRRRFQEIQTDPKRALRNLVDLGCETAGGQLQKEFLGIIKRILRKEDSSYYTMVQNINNSVDEDRLVTFGMNLGWNSFTQGAKKIRAEEALRGCNIPWSLTLYIEGKQISIGDYLWLIREGTELGIYSYLIFARDGYSVQLAVDLARANRGCAFCLLLPAGFDEECEKACFQAEFPPNMILGVDGCSDVLNELVRRMREEKYLYLIYRTYSTSDDVHDIISGRWAKRIMPLAGLAALLVEGKGVDKGESDSVYSYVMDVRMKQRNPILFLDLYRDNLYMDACISGDPCYFGILPDGTVTEYKKGHEIITGFSILEKPLADMFNLIAGKNKEA